MEQNSYEASSVNRHTTGSQPLAVPGRRSHLLTDSRVASYWVTYWDGKPIYKKRY
jgi:hypothetical protein